MVFLFNLAARNVLDMMLLAVVLLVQAGVVFLLLRTPSLRGLRARRGILMAAAASACLLLIGFLLLFARFNRHFPAWIGAWVRGSAMIWAVLSMLWTAAWLIHRALRASLATPHSSSRRGFLNTAGASLFLAPAAVLGYGIFVQRFNLRLREQEIVIPGLAGDLDGIRIVQLTDIHLSPYLSERELMHAVAMANETFPHLALVTGDMISGGSDPLDACLKHLAGLRAEAGIYGCLGNHEIYANAEDYAAAQGARLGIHYLRNESARLKFGGATMNLAGVDYQRFHAPYLTGAEKLVAPGVFNMMMSHNPDVFPVAARQGYDLTVSGHTHGGQVRVEILRQDLNVARFFTPYVDGLYRRDGRAVFVSRGIGTIGLPARIGAPPEVALLRLCRS
ncbi:MAG TPA: metallophosphoesterase [Bryobacteraceae bacterium]|nr:metallophosphoesterase [Bryobacteraceae bacterium]